ncbi:MAG: GlsB/YeaQ/YmgE family stress response membrane protein [Thermoleophilaceae bacterium]
MSLIVYLFLLAISGLFVGALARLALPGRDPLSIPQTIGLGLAGSFSAGLLSILVLGRNVVGLFLSIAGAMVILYFVRRSRGGGLLDPGESPDRLR